MHHGQNMGKQKTSIKPKERKLTKIGEIWGKLKNFVKMGSENAIIHN